MMGSLINEDAGVSDGIATLVQDPSDSSWTNIGPHEIAEFKFC